MQEVEHTLSYARIQRKYNVSLSNVQRLLTELANSALIFAGSAEVAGAAPDDPDDEVVLACAIDGRADLIVTGDHHLLGLGEFRGIPIVPVRQLLERLADQDAARPNR